MRRLIVEDTPLAGLKRVRRNRLGDSRGFLARLFCADELAEAGWIKPVAQVNHTRTRQRGSVRGVRDRMAVEHVDVVGECLQAVRESFRDQESDAVLVAERLRVPAQEGRRASPQVDGDVPHLAAQAVDQLHLGVRRCLEMKSANAAALARSRVVNLRARLGPARLANLVGAEEAGQEAARIAEPVAAHALQTGERRVLDDAPTQLLRPEPSDEAAAA